MLRSALAVRCWSGAHCYSPRITMGPGSAEQREERCTASGTRNRLPHILSITGTVYLSRVTVEGSSTPFSSISTDAFGIASITSMPRVWQMLSRPAGNAGLRRLDFAIIEIQQRALLVDRGSADDGVVNLELADQADRGRADHRAVGAAHRTAGHDHLDARMSIKQHRDVEVVGDDQQVFV